MSVAALPTDFTVSSVAAYNRKFQNSIDPELLDQLPESRVDLSPCSEDLELPPPPSEGILSSPELSSRTPSAVEIDESLFGKREYHNSVKSLQDNIQPTLDQHKQRPNQLESEDNLQHSPGKSIKNLNYLHLCI